MRAHLSINVTDVERSVAFYAKVFGAKPQKQTASYAKFDLKEPALNFSMHSGGSRSISKVNHLGIEVDSTEEVTAWNARLDEIGVTTTPEEGTECCFARQDKVWFSDPDGNAWEVFFVHEQLPTEGAEPPKRKAACGPASGCC